MAQLQNITRRRTRASLWTLSSSFTIICIVALSLLLRGMVATLLSSSTGLNKSFASWMGVQYIGITPAEGLEKRAGVYDKQESATTTSTPLGGPPPAITSTGDFTRPYGVENDTFANYDTAKQRSCSDQFNKCQLMANNNETAGFTVSDCENQQNTCLTLNDAVDSSSSSTTSVPMTTETTTTTESTETATALSNLTSNSALISTATATATDLSSTTISFTSETSITTVLSTMTTVIATVSDSASPTLITTTTSATASSTSQSHTIQHTTITQDQYILICDL